MVTLNFDGRAAGEPEALVGTVIGLQMTLNDVVKLSGTGLHGGKTTSVIIHPASEDTGIVFRVGSSTIPGLASEVVSTARGTTIGSDGAQVSTIEHLMAALRGLGVDNAMVEVTGSETPALDGSALPYVEAINAVGLAPQSAKRNPVMLPGPVSVQRGDSFILAIPASEMRITYVMNYDHPLIGTQTGSYVLRESDFADAIAPARTFVLYEEVAGLLEQHLARGGNLDNAIVIWQDKMSSKLRFPDELVRHKVMDLIGDFSLIGGLLHAEILAVKSGHKLNVEFAQKVNEMLSESGVRAVSA